MNPQTKIGIMRVPVNRYLRAWVCFSITSLNWQMPRCSNNGRNCSSFPLFQTTLATSALAGCRECAACELKLVYGQRGRREWRPRFDLAALLTG